MTDFHRNVFYYYRGAQRSNKDRDSQLENNTTKALINTLDHCGDAVALRFLDWLGIETAGQVKYELQKETIGDIGNKSQRLLLGIVPAKEEDNPCAEGVAAGSRGIPDAWLYGDDYAVLIESKVMGSLEPGQMRKHLHKLQAGTAQQPEYKVRTWAQVHRFFKALPNEIKDVTDLDTWLIGQFTQYLEWRGMAEFAGLEQGMFDYFRPDSRDDGDRQWVYGLLPKKFWKGYRVLTVRSTRVITWGNSGSKTITAGSLSVPGIKNSSSRLTKPCRCTKTDSTFL